MVARTSAFDRNIKKSRKNVRNFRTTAAGAIKTIGKFAGGLVAAAGVAGVVVFIKKSMAAIDVTAKLSDRLRIATEDIIALRHAAEITGVASDALDKSLEMFVRRLGEVRQGTGEAKRALEELGIDVNKLVTLSPAKAFSLIADEINKMALQADKAVVAYQLFGRAGTKLLNTLALGSEGLAEMKRDAEALGLTFSRFDAAKVEEANDAIQRMRSTFVGIGQDAAIGLAPVIQALSDITTETIKAARKRKEVLNELSGRGPAGNLQEGLLDNVKTEIDLAKLVVSGFEKQIDKLKATTDDSAHGFFEYRQELGALEQQLEGATRRVKELQTEADIAAVATANAEAFAAAAAKAKKFNEALEDQIRLFEATATEKAIDKLSKLGDTLTGIEKDNFDALIEKARMLGIELENLGKKTPVDPNIKRLEDLKSFADSVIQSLKGPLELFKDARAKIKEAEVAGFLSAAKAAEAIIAKSQQLLPVADVKGDQAAGGGPAARGQSQEVRTAFVNVAALSAGGQDSVIKEQEKTTEELKKQTNLLRQMASQEIR